MLQEKTAAAHSQRWLFAAFALSGFSGLIYESIWSHYLKLLLGHAAYAQTLVLVIFMGGMAIGAAWASRLTSRRRNLLRLYAAVEAAIGLLGLVFDPLFRHWLEFSLSTVIPSIGFPQGVEAYKWASSGLLILPQSVMLGMTFPLMTGGVIRRFPQSTGGSIAMLYFTNSIGGALGALCSAFWLLGAMGLSGTLVVAALVNLALAAVVWFLGAEEERPLATPVAAGHGDPDLPRRFLVAAFVTGAASFIYEIVWIRMLALVLGSSTQAFELMLSAFITGLALGGLWIRNRIDRIADPVRFSGYVQMAMGGLALATLVFYNGTFDLMAYALRAINRTDEAYPLFNLFSHAIAFAVMLPATFMAGMTLPLFTHVLIRQGHGEASVGRIYASNTLGAIAGVAFAVHVGLPGAGIKLALSAGALADMFLGAYLLRFCASRWYRAEALAASLVAAVAVAAATTFARLDPLRMASGVFRLGDHQLLAGHELLFYQDGSTATITVTRAPDGGVMIATNGKPDATISLDPTRPPSNDEITMVMAGSLPLLLKPDARKVANIGLGSGLTTHTVLTHSGVERVDTVEIEPAMVAGATAFRARVPAAFADPRSHMQIEDAKTYFARHGVRYDVIISEPSNPWVSGVASLFTTEFYRDVRRHLKDDGLLVQWFHLYEVDDRLVSTVILALAENFDDFAIYLTDTTNMLIVAPRNGKLPSLQAPSPTQRAFIEGMARVGLRGPEDFAVRRIGDKAVALAAVSGFGIGPNSDFLPRLQLEATATRFTQARADIRNLGIAPLPVLEALDGRHQDLAQAASVTANPRLPRSMRLHEARQVRDLLLARGRPWDLPDPEARLHVGTVTGASALCAESPVPESYSLHWVAERTIPYLPPAEAAALWSTPAWLPCRKPAAWLRERLDLYAAVARRDGAGISALAGNMLARGAGAGELEWRRYILSAGMFGEQLGGRSDAAEKIWRQYGDELYGGFPPPAAVRVLAGYRRPGSDGPR